MKDKPNKIKAKLIVEVEAEFYDDEIRISGIITWRCDILC